MAYFPGNRKLTGVLLALMLSLATLASASPVFAPPPVLPR